MREAIRNPLILALMATAMASPTAYSQSTGSNVDQSLRERIAAAAALLDRASLTLQPQVSSDAEPAKPPIIDPEELDGQLQRAAGPTLKFSGRVQIRNLASIRHRPSGTELQNGFTINRLVLSISHKVSDALSVYGEMSASRSTGQFTLSNIFVSVRLSDDWSLRVGQFRPPFLREQFISSGRQLAVERSLISSALGQRSGTGVRVRWATHSTRFYAAMMDRGGDLGGLQRWATTARIEHLLVGSFGRVRDFSPDPRGRSAVLLGAAIAYQFENRPNGRVERSRLRWTGDLSIKRGRSAFFVSATGAHITRNDGGASLDQFGLVAQGAYRLTEHWEAFARGEFGIADEAGSNLALATIGVNAFFFGRNGIKFSADAGYSFTPVDNIWSVTRAGFLTDAPGRDGQLVFRTQLQVTF